MDLPQAKANLTLWKADLADEGSFDEAISGCSGVFHVATPMDFESKDPEVILFYFTATLPKLISILSDISVFGNTMEE